MAPLPPDNGRSLPERDVIVALYRGILGRVPSGDEIEHHRRALAADDLSAVVAAFVNSSEFALRKTDREPGFAPLGYEKGNTVETALDPAAIDRIWAHTSQVWRGLGETDALWSVITHDSLRADRNLTPAQVDAFYQGGRGDVRYIRAFVERAGRKLSDFPVAVEYGCGVGRVTHWLAREFGHVHAYDISTSHLEAARRYIEAKHIPNVTFHLVEQRSDLASLTGFDFFVSLIVLQHNPPPVIMDILERAFGGLNRNGLAVFQVPVYHRDYGFDEDSYWAKVAQRREMEMHFVPQRAILTLADRCGMVALEVRNDHLIGMHEDAISSTFVLQKR